jgi:hypothetical protein
MACYLLFKYWVCWKYQYNKYMFHFVDHLDFIPVSGCVGRALSALFFLGPIMLLRRPCGSSDVDEVLFEWSNQGRIQDFKLGGALKQIAPSGGRRENVWVFRVKNHDFTPKNHIFSDFRGVRPPPPLDPPLRTPRVAVGSVASNEMHLQCGGVARFCLRAQIELYFCKTNQWNLPTK